MKGKQIAGVLIGAFIAFLGLLRTLQGTGILHIRPILCVTDCEEIVGVSASWAIAGVIAFCGVCIEKCPQSVVDDVYEAGLGYRKAIYRPFPQAVPKYPVIDTAACTYFKSGKCKACQIFCTPGAIDFEQKDETLRVHVGNIVLATGYDLFDCAKVSQYGHGRLANVFTSLEFERLCNAAGPTTGRIVRRDGVTEPKRVAVIHCVGSRDVRHHEYCSAVCCMSALKFGHLILEKTKAGVWSFYIDMRPLHKG